MNDLYDTTVLDEHSLVSYRPFTAMLVWSVFFNFTKMFVIIVMYAYFIGISQGSVQMHLWCGGICINHVLANCLQMCQWKNCENQSIIGEDINNSKVPRFLRPTLYFLFKCTL